MSTDDFEPEEPEAIDGVKIVPDGLSPSDATKLDDEIGVAGSQAIGGLAGDGDE